MRADHRKAPSGAFFRGGARRTEAPLAGSGAHPHAECGRVEESLERLVQSIALAQGLELYDLVLRRTGPRWKLQVFLSRAAERVSLDDCERVSRQLSRELDALDLIAQAYDLEVSSPGVERPLRQPWHFCRAVGEQVAVRWRDRAGRVQHVVARLTAADDARIRLAPGGGGEELEVELSALLAARIFVDWRS